VTSTRELDSLFSSTINRFGRLDALVNSAGVTGLDTIYEITDESWNHIIDVNLKAVFFTSQKALAIMTDQGFGKIVNLSSNAGKSGGKAVGAHYSASKAGVICPDTVFGPIRRGIRRTCQLCGAGTHSDPDD
jgi:NAD(P)-dependent dehydrogenase (short-subunit alcohol dehydrogenase family)